uniref:Phospholipid-transporting ATPase n=1 Tax=Petromyzon marinus TaxID=7757 RepID=A0AAJ7UJC2_PETMA
MESNSGRKEPKAPSGSRVILVGPGHPASLLEAQRFPDNKIVSSKYTPWNFIPKNLFEQFRRIGNFYFLMIFLVQVVIDSPTSPATSGLPLLFVIAVTAVKQGYEDWRRHRSDATVNDESVELVVPAPLTGGAAGGAAGGAGGGALRTSRSSEVRVGDVVCVRRDGTFPCDLLVLATSGRPGGACHVTTASLDGESNLKSRFALAQTASLGSPEQLSRFTARVECILPSPDLYQFNGSLTVIGGGTQGEGPHEATARPILFENLVLRGATLKNTAIIYGLAVYTGMETKMALNYKKRSLKRSAVEKSMNSFLLVYLCLLVSMALVSSVMKFVTESGSAAPWYNGRARHEDGAWRPLEMLVDFLSFMVLYNYVIPVSLYVSVEMQKFLGSRFVGWDLRLRDPNSHEPAVANTSDLNEELGQVEYVLTDKTGTLTENVMSLKKLSLRGVKYQVHHGEMVPEGGGRGAAGGGGGAGGDVPDGGLGATDSPEWTSPSFLLTALALCHTVNINTDTGTGMDTDIHTGGGDSGGGPVGRDAGGEGEGEAAPLMGGAGEVLVVEAAAAVKVPHASSPECHASSPECHASSPECHASSPERHASSPECHASSPECHASSPECHASSPECHASSPERHASSPERHASSPECHASSPECHASSPECHASSPEYYASSPDEKALVEAASRLGVIFLGLENQTMRLCIQGQLRSFEVLDTLEFDPKRRCMSVVLRRTCGGDVFVVTKGADSAVLPRVIDAEGELQATQRHVDDFAMEGLRTLCYAVRPLSGAAWADLSERLRAARTALASRQDAIDAAYDAVESQLWLLGATAVEDRLQEEVPRTIRELSHAGISVWVLTGDKLETAVSVAYACGLFARHTRLHHLLPGAASQLEGLALDTAPGGSCEKLQHALVVDGSCMWELLSQHRRRFQELSQLCSAVVCCRLSPLQKAEVVRLVKALPGSPITLAIGDGANDVSMIQEAHVGIGVMGREGRQAARSGDFALHRFCHLRRLLLVHGHLYYVRIAQLVQYFFYKNVCFIAPQFFYQFHCGFSQQTLYTSAYLAMYNICFTSLPILVYGLMEQNLPLDVLEANPLTYRDIARNRLLAPRAFLRWTLLGVLHATALFLGPFLLLFLPQSATLASGEIQGQWSFGTLVFTTMVISVNIK